MSIASTYLSGLTSCEPAWNEKPVDPDPALGRVLDQPDGRVRVAAELARQVDDRVGIPERDAQQQADPRAAGVELGDLLGVVDDEGRDAAVERVADVRTALDRVGVDAAARRDAGVPDEVHLAVRRKVKPGSLARKHLDHGPVGQGLQRVVQVDAGQGPCERVVLASQELAVDHEQRRAELDDEGLERVGYIGRRKAQVRLQSVFSLNRAEDRPESAGDQVRRGSRRARPCRPRP